MFYSITSIVIGALLFMLFIYGLIKKESLIIDLLNIVFSLAFIGIGIWSLFLLGKDLEFVPMIVMLGVAVLYIIINILVNKKTKETKETKKETRK